MSRTYFPGPKSAKIETKILAGKIEVASGSAGPTSDSIPYASASRVAEGHYRITFDDRYHELLHADVSAFSPDPATSTWQAVISGSTASTLDFFGGYLSQSNSACVLVKADPSSAVTFVFNGLFSQSMT